MIGPVGAPRLATLWWVLGWAMVAFILYSTLAPVQFVPDLQVSDKIEHGAAFFGLTLWFGGLVRRGRYWLVGIIMSAFGAAIEIAQGVMGWGRDMDIYDWMADTGGVLLALAVLYSVPRHRGSWFNWVESLIRR